MENQPTILIVDDDNNNLQILGRMLKDSFYKIAVATDGKMAIEIAREVLPDIILLDVMMPVMNGFETCQQLKSDPRLKSIPVLFITVLNEVELALKGFSVGAVDYITKPFNRDILLSRVNTQIQLKKKTDELKELNKTLEKKVEERTLELEKANIELFQMDELKTEFLKIISQEIQTPLNGLLNVIELIKQEYENESILSFISSLDTSAQKLENFSLNALKYTLLKAGEFKLTIEKYSMKKLIDDIITNLDEKIIKKNALLNVQISSNIFINIDKELMTSCISSILNYAIKFSDHQAEISINADDVEGKIRCIIISKGESFSEKALNNLFKPFRPERNFINESEALELAICNLIMKAHNFEIQVQNTANGAAVHLIFN